MHLYSIGDRAVQLNCTAGCMLHCCNPLSCHVSTAKRSQNSREGLNKVPLSFLLLSSCSGSLKQLICYSIQMS